jgi:hypothetical protein
MNAEQIMDRLEAAGALKKLGRGAFGLAFELPNGDVLKVWADDNAYEQYIKYAMKNKSNPYLIRVLGKVHEFKIKNSNDAEFDERIKFVRIEKLTMASSLKDFGYDEPNENKSHNFFQGVQSYINLEDTHETDGKKLLEILRLDEEKSTPRFEKFLGELIKILGDLNYRKTGHDLDLAVNNFGLRGNQIVLIDPIRARSAYPIRHVLKYQDDEDEFDDE